MVKSVATTGFTFYGDLLGIASAYRLSHAMAHSKLNRFYNSVFGIFADFCGNSGSGIHVQMYSDSVVIWGNANVPEILQHLQDLYLVLVSKNLLLRGAVVHGALEKEPRVEV